MRLEKNCITVMSLLARVAKGLEECACGLVTNLSAFSGMKAVVGVISFFFIFLFLFFIQGKDTRHITYK